MAGILDGIVNAFTGNKRQTGSEVLSIAQRGKRSPGSLTKNEIISLCMSVISQARR